MIRKENSYFILDTMNTTYCFRVMETGQLEHLYYGKKVTLKSEDDIHPLVEKQAFAPGNANVYDEEHKTVTLEDIRLEMSSYGKGDIREAFIEVVHADGSFTSDFLFEKAEISNEKIELENLPTSYDDEGEVQQLCVTLKDKQYDLILELYYSVFDDCDVITRSARLINSSKETVKLLRLMSLQLDFDTADYTMTTFTGAWAREMKKNGYSNPCRKICKCFLCGRFFK